MFLFVAIIVLSHLWARQTARDTMMKTYGDIVELHTTACLPSEKGEAAVALGDDWRSAILGKLQTIRRVMVRNSYVQSGIDILALALMFAVYRILRRRELSMEREKAKAKSFFFSTVSHDIRTPLNAIIGFSEMLKSGFKSEEERQQAIDAILVSGKTLLELVNDVLDLSKLEAGKMAITPEPTDCAVLLREVVKAFNVAQKQFNIDLRCRVDDMPPLMVDPQRLRQIAFNLVGNAMKFTKDGYVEVRASFSHGTFHLEVEDTGCGIGEEDLKRIGSAYVQVGAKESRNGGTGLGLAICRQLVAAMGGSLKVESELGRGSTFSIDVSGVRVAKEMTGGTGGSGGTVSLAPGSPVSQALPVKAPLRVLVVDDSKMNVMVLKALLKYIGEFDVVSAADGQEALEILKAPNAGRFDLVMTDMWMPRLDGAGLVKAIRADSAFSGVRVLVVTADVEFQPKFAEFGFDGILLKPITKNKLADALAKALR